MSITLKNKSWKIGLTGGIGCGKSTAAGILEELGLRRLDTDLVARRVVEPSSPGLNAVVREFGESVLLSDGTLDRKELGRLVFASPERRQALESILHPLIWGEVQTFLERCQEEQVDCVVEVPLLFENGRQGDFDRVWVVSASPSVQRERLRKRSGWSDREIELRLQAQLPLRRKCELADTVFVNDGDRADLVVSLREAVFELRGGGSNT